MFEFPAKDLTKGDKFTIDNGETWHTVRDVAVRPNVGHTVVVVYTDDEPIELDPNELIIVQ